MISLGRKSAILVLLLLCAAVLAAAQNQAYTTGHPSTTQTPGIFLLRPLQKCIGALSGVWDAIAAQGLQKSRLQDDNEHLRRDLALATVRNNQLQQIAAQNDRLRQLLHMKQVDAGGAHWITANVVERHPSHWFQYLTLDQGASAGIHQQSVVITADGLVGHVIMVRPDTCDVLLVTDPLSNAGAIVSRTRDVGYVSGAGHQQLVMSFFDHDHGVKPGDTVVASPYSSVYPSGIPIGTITSISEETGTTTRVATVQPAVRFNTMEEAVVIP